jgi:hypothetical protein
MSQDLALSNTVALTDDVPEHDLQRGCVGTIVEQLAPDTYEVEFTDDDGTPYALAPLADTQLLKVRTTPRAVS